MGSRRRLLPWVVSVAVAATALPALAFGQGNPGPDANIIVTDYAFRDAAGMGATVEIPAGADVGFSYPTGLSRHNIVFAAKQPTTCTQTAGDRWLPAPPLPWYQQGPGWAGTCTFEDPGVYEFHSGLNWNMRGAVIVAATPTPTPTATPTATPTVTATPTPPTRAAVQAHDTVTPLRNWFQDAASSDPADNSVTVDVGATVDFSFPTGSGTSSHNVEFATNPASCVQRTGVVVFPTAPPLPQFAIPAGWSGECTFSTPGVYAFVCTTHRAEMTGTVVVRGEGEPTPTPTPTPTATATPEPPRDATPAAAPKPWAAIDKPATTNLTVARFLNKKLKITARCVAAGSGRIALTVTPVVARRIGLDGTTLSEADATCSQNNRVTVKLSPTANARRALEDHRAAVPATLTLQMAGPAGPTSATRTIKLKGKGRAR